MDGGNTRNNITMKLFLIFLTMAVFIFALVSCEQKCEFNCDLQDYKPICGTDDSGDTKTFNNMCILKTENCLRKSSYQKTGDGDCP